MPTNYTRSLCMRYLGITRGSRPAPLAMRRRRRRRRGGVMYGRGRGREIRAYVEEEREIERGRVFPPRRVLCLWSS